MYLCTRVTREKNEQERGAAFHPSSFILRPCSRCRSGATLVESAIVLGLLFFFLIGLIISGIGIHRYQEVASLAREGARWASVRGGQYAAETGQAPATQATIDAYVRSLPAALT